MTPEELEMLPARVTLADLQPVRRRSRRSLLRGNLAGQSVLTLQVMGQMWERWERWGALRNG